MSTPDEPNPADIDVVPHPAKWSAAVLERIAAVVAGLPDGPILDPFAGVGGARLAQATGRTVVGIELESEWGETGSIRLVGNALSLPVRRDSVDLVVTSPTYGNRMADHHEAQEKCKPCGATGWIHGPGDSWGDPCPKCEGLGHRTYKRLTYRHQLGRALHPDNSGRLQWGPRYRAFHEAAWAEVRRVLEPGGRFVLNVKDHVRAHEIQPVVEWHRETLLDLWFELAAWHEVETDGMGFGQNRGARAPFEVVAVFRKGTWKT